MPPGLEFRRPFPSRKAAESLRDQVVEYLLGQRVTVGDRFPTEVELTSMTGLSRSTIRRGLDLLRREGWVQSRAGSGTVIGPKALTLAPSENRQDHRLRSSGTGGKTVRLAIVVLEIGDFLSSWYWREIITGIDELAERCKLSLELIGGLNGSIESIQRRLERNRPDLIACMGSEPRHAFIVRTAETMGIPCAVVGTTTWDSGGIKLCEDNQAIVQTAVDHLVDLGHRRIALTIGRHMHGWIFERHKAFYDAMRVHGLDVDEELVHWLGHEFSSQSNKPDLERFLKRSKPTALLAASFSAMEPLALLVQDQSIEVPRQLSVVAIDQNPGTLAMMRPIDLTCVEIPLREFGRRLVELTATTGRSEPLPPSTCLGGLLHTGTSTTRVIL